MVTHCQLKTNEDLRRCLQKHAGRLIEGELNEEGEEGEETYPRKFSSNFQLSADGIGDDDLLPPSFTARVFLVLRLPPSQIQFPLLSHVMNR